MEPMFDKDSFQEEITTKAEAQSAVAYLSHNERNFRKGLMDEGLTHEQEDAEVALVWGNLLKSCKRVGFSDGVTQAKAEQFKA
jgi:hypothetical protein